MASYMQLLRCELYKPRVIMITAFTYWNTRIAPVFDTARQLYLVESDNKMIVKESTIQLPEDLPAEKILRLLELGVSTLVCGAISKAMYGLVAARGIHVVPFVAGELTEVSRAWLEGRLANPLFTMPGCRGQGGRRFRRMLGASEEEHAMKGKGSCGTARGGGMGQGMAGPGRGRMGGPKAAGSIGVCGCPQCDYTEPHERGVPCAQKKCPKCGSMMTR